MLYADVLLCILLIYPLQPGRGRIICKHKKDVYNKDVSGIINEGIHGEYHSCLNSYKNKIIFKRKSLQIYFSLFLIKCHSNYTFASCDYV